MNIKDFFAGLLTGVAAGVVLTEVVSRTNPYVSPDLALENAKNAFLKDGPIDGSWVVMKTENFQKGLIDLEVYRGGVTRMVEGELEQFEFAADAKTGTIVEIEQI